MAQNMFEELQAKKHKLISLAHTAKEYGWIDSAREKEIKEKIENDVLTIGVIGQMKCGKSTFLNAFVFEDDVLPSATTPMTAALSVITYGEQKKIIAEFYTKDEWEEQKFQASRSLDEVAGNALEESKIKAAKELMEKSSKLGSNLLSYLGKSQSDSFENLIEYVGAEGKYISITKAVTIYYPKEYLKGVEIVDTPGFNDPIVSREERTKDFLKRADVVLLMLYAGRPFDATDRDILFKNVAQCGTGKVLVGINKYDIPLENGEDENQIKEYVKEQIRRACRECNDDRLVEIIQAAEPIPLSAEMALLSEMPMTKITSNDAYDFALKRHLSTFEISPNQLRGMSHIDDLTFAIKKVVENEKEEILFRKPLNAIMAAGNKRKTDVESEIQKCNVLIETLSQPDDELEERQTNLNKANRRLNKKIDGLGDDIESVMKDIIRKGRNQLEDSVEISCKRMDSIIDGLGRFSSPNTIIPNLDREVQTLITRTLKRDVEDISNSAIRKIQNTANEFFNDAEDVLMRYIPEFDSRSFIKGIEKEINLDIEDNSLFEYSNDTGNEDYGIVDMLYDFLNGATYGLLGGVTNMISHGDYQREMHNNVNNIRNVDVSSFLDSIYERKNEIIERLKVRFIDELVKPLQEKIEEIIANKDKKEKELQENKEKIEKLKSEKALIEKQLKEVA